MANEMISAPAEPSRRLTSPTELLPAYLDFYRATLLHEIEGLDEAESRRSRLPSGWTPLGLVKHLAHVERRWLRWGFTAERVEAPWGDSDPDGEGWLVGDDESVAGILAFYQEQCERAREIATSAPLEQRAALGGRFTAEDEAPTLGWILFHLLQEYARHLGHLDVARELADGGAGE